MLVEDLICKGKDFHSSGPATVKQRSPRVDRVLSVLRWSSVLKQGCTDWVFGVAMQLGRGLKP